MNVNFTIKLGEGSNKNFLVYMSTELAKKLEYELIDTDEIMWTFKKGETALFICHGEMIKEPYKVEEEYYEDTYKSRKKTRTVTKYRENLVKDRLLLKMVGIDSIDSVNAIFDIANKYADLIIDERKELDDSDTMDELTELLNDEVAATVE